MITSHRLHCQIPKVIIVGNASATFQAMSGVCALSILTTSGKTQHSQWEKSNIRENKKFTLNITHAMNIESDEENNRKRESWARICIYLMANNGILLPKNIDTQALNNQDEYWVYICLVIIVCMSWNHIAISCVSPIHYAKACRQTKVQMDHIHKGRQG